MKINVFLAVLIFSFLVFGQSGTGDMTNSYSGFGIKAGLNIADLDGDGISGLDSRKGLSAGFFKEFQISQNSFIQVDLIYVMKGASYELEDYVYKQMMSPIKFEFIFDYIEIPVFFKFKIPAQMSSIPYVYLGGAASYNINAEIKASMDGVTEKENVEDSVEDIDLGFVFGGGIEVPVNRINGRLIFDIRNTYGMTSIIDEQGFEMFNRVWTFTVGYGF